MGLRAPTSTTNHRSQTSITKTGGFRHCKTKDGFPKGARCLLHVAHVPLKRGFRRDSQGSADDDSKYHEDISPSPLRRSRPASILIGLSIKDNRSCSQSSSTSFGESSACNCQRIRDPCSAFRSSVSRKKKSPHRRWKGRRCHTPRGPFPYAHDCPTSTHCTLRRRLK